MFIGFLNMVTFVEDNTPTNLSRIYLHAIFDLF